MMAEWMSSLPYAARDKPLTTLAIPGSHLSGTCALTNDSEITPDQAWVVRALNPSSIVRRAVHSWSTTQTISIKQQLEAGVRFLDVRVAYLDGTIYVIHGLRAMEIRDLFKSVYDFIIAHPKEVVLIDINSFYQFRAKEHDELLVMIRAIFGDKLIDEPTTSLGVLGYSLNKIWDLGRVIVFYDQSDSRIDINGHAGPSSAVRPPAYVWSHRFIRRPWPKTEDANKMIAEVAELVRDRVLEDGFQVCKAIVTLTVDAIMRQPTGTFEQRFGRRATRALVDWLRQEGHQHRRNLNIILADFVDENNFCDAVIDLNR